MVGLPAGLFAIQSVGQLNHPAGLLSNLSSIYLIANQLTKDCSFISACIRSVLEFPVLGVRSLPILIRLVGCGGTT